MKKGTIFGVIAILAVAGAVGACVASLFPAKKTPTISTATPYEDDTNSTDDSVEEAVDSTPEDNSASITPQPQQTTSTPTPTTSSPDYAAEAEAERIRKADLEYERQRQEAQAQYEARRATELEERRIANLRQNYISGRSNELSRNQSVYFSAKSACQSEAASRGMAYSNTAAVCMVNRYGGSVGDYYPNWTDSAQARSAQSINAKYDALCAAIGGC